MTCGVNYGGVLLLLVYKASRQELSKEMDLPSFFSFTVCDRECGECVCVCVFVYVCTWEGKAIKTRGLPVWHMNLHIPTLVFCFGLAQCLYFRTLTQTTFKEHFFTCVVLHTDVTSWRKYSLFVSYFSKPSQCLQGCVQQAAPPHTN